MNLNMIQVFQDAPTSDYDTYRFDMTRRLIPFNYNWDGLSTLNNTHIAILALNSSKFREMLPRDQVQQFEALIVVFRTMWENKAGHAFTLKMNTALANIGQPVPM